MARKKAATKSAPKSAAKSAKRSAVAAAVKESAKKPARNAKAAKDLAAPEKPATIEVKSPVPKPGPVAVKTPPAEAKPAAKKRGRPSKKKEEAPAKPVEVKVAPAPKPEPVAVKAAPAEAKPAAKKRGRPSKKQEEAPAKPVDVKAAPAAPAPVVAKAPAPAPAAKKLVVEVKPAPKAIASAKPIEPPVPAAPSSKKIVQPVQPVPSVLRKELPAPVARKELPAPAPRKELAAPPPRKELPRLGEGKPPAERTAARAALITPSTPPPQVPVVERTTPPAAPSAAESPVRRSGSRRAVARRQAPRTVPPAAKPSSIFAKLRAAEALKKKALPKSKAEAPVPTAPATPLATPPAPEHEPAPLPSELVDRGAPLPDAYGLDRLVALVRDPKWLFSYWELTGGLLDRVKAERGHGLIDASAWVLRIHRLSEGVAVDVELDPGVGNWYIDVGGPGRYQLELGLLTPDGEFISLLASQVVETPGLGPSSTFDEEWRLRMEDEERLLAILRKELGMDARLGGASQFVGASVLPSSWRLPGSFLGASFSGRPAAGSWAWSFLGASGLPTSGRSVGSGGWMNVGWIVGADGRHEAELFRPMRNGGPNWNEQKNLQRLGGPGKSQQPHFKVRLPRTVKGAPLPAPSWPPSEQRPRSAVRTRRVKPKAKGAGKVK